AQGVETMGTLKPQPGENRNGVRKYLKVRMPTFNFSPNELRTLVRFFLAVSAQQEPYIKESLEPLSPDEQNLARALFTSQAAPCLKCHMTGDAGHDLTATAPNFLDSSTRLKSDWTFRWLLDPQRIMPGTAMPSELFKRDGERWIFNGPLPPQAADYQGDHARLLVRYLLQLTPEEQARTSRTVPATSGAPPVETARPVASRGGMRGVQRTTQNTAAVQRRRDGQTLSRAARPPRRRMQVSARREPAVRRARERTRQRQVAAAARRGARDFSP
ncbi:MAG: hypothetical protein LC802_13680, partial [Acidobacteria bacterium]|nr:hypothetical protein [Acidobacteriota bacterium]